MRGRASGTGNWSGFRHWWTSHPWHPALRHRSAPRIVNGRRTIQFECLERRELLAANLMITEFMAANGRTLFDRDGDTPDWIEIHNAGSAAVDLTGWTLTDDPSELGKWEFPALTMDPDEYLVAFASGKASEPDNNALNRDFHATNNGTFVVDLPDGSYSIHLTMGDPLEARDKMAVYVQGKLLTPEVTRAGLLDKRWSTRAGEVVEPAGSTRVRDATGGQLAIRFEDMGGTTTRAIVNSLTITPADGGTPYRFDFGTADSPVAPGYTKVVATDTYEAGTNDHGWLPGAAVTARDRAVQPHTNFKLSADGEYLGLVSPTGVVVAEFGPGGSDYPGQRQDVSYGWTPDGSRYFKTPTPGAPNRPGQTGFVSATSFSQPHGIYEQPIDVAMTTATAGATIRYTTDGSVPTEENGAVYSGPITVAQTTTLRAVALKPGLVPTRVQTQTYLFVADVLKQDGSQLVSAPWGHPVGGAMRPDWEVDPKIVHHPDPASRLVVNDLLTIPTVSIVMDFDEMFGSVGADGTAVNGIYNTDEGIERATSVELLNPDGSKGFQIDGSVQIVGGTSPVRWNADKLSMRLKFNRQYGSGNLEYPLFGDRASSSFDTLVLDARYNYTWHKSGSVEQRLRAQSLRDQFASDLQLAVGSYGPHGRPVHLYIDGIYWGLYHVHERPDDNFAAAYFGGDNDDYDVIKHHPDWVVHGSADSYERLLTAVDEDLTDPANYQAVLDLLDVDDFIRYMLVNFYSGNTDWGGHNWYATYDRVDPAGRWHFHSWDAEWILQDTSTDVTGMDNPGGPTGIHQRLLANPEYRLRFADHVHRQLFNDGVLTPTGAAKLYQTRLDEIDRAVVAESARWGDNRRQVPYTRGVEWVRERDRLLNDFFPWRTGIVLNQLRSRGVYPDVDAPEFSQHGGQIVAPADIQLTASEGTIYFTTDGTDPRLVGGGTAPGAMEFTAPIQLHRSGTVNARVLRNGQWSALSQATFEVLSELPLRVTEINYNPHDANLVPGLGEVAADNDRFEFLEVANVGASAINLDGVRLMETIVEGDRQGIDFTFAPQTLAPGGHLVVVRDRDAFASRYGADVPVALGRGAGAAVGEYVGKLANGGERITLLDAAGAIVQHFAYRTDAAWPSRARGQGSTLEVIDATGDYGDPANWRASNQFGGTPGRAGTAWGRDVVVNEALTRGTGGDRIELHNTTSHAVDVSGWYLSDDGADLLKVKLPPATTVPAGGYTVVNLAPLGIDLDGTITSEIWLVASDPAGRPLRFVDHVVLDASDIGVAMGRWPDGDPDGIVLPMTQASFGAPNSGPATGRVIISEVDYHHGPIEPILAEDFTAGTADGLVPVLGTWTVHDSGYEVTPDENGDTIATVATAEPLPASFVLTTTLRARAISGFNQSAAIIFDYHSPTDFKFVSMHPRPGKWRLGQRDASGWNFLMEKKVDLGIQVDTAIDAAIEVHGSSVVFWTEAVSLSYDFGTPLNRGKVGLGSKGGTPRFEQVKLARLGDQEDLAFVELAGTTGTPIDLAGWRLDGAANMTFAPGASVDDSHALIVVDFDPADIEKAAFFRGVYGMEDSVALAGPVAGSWRDDGGVVRLTKPVELAEPNTRFIPVDQIAFDNRSPWPTAADGHGRALSRAAAAAIGRLPSSWSAVVPTPGTVRFAETGDIDFDGAVTGDDIRPFTELLADPSAYQTAFGVPAAMAADADGDGDVDFDDIDDFVALLSSGTSIAARRAGGEADGTRSEVTRMHEVPAFGKDRRPVVSIRTRVRDRLSARPAASPHRPAPAKQLAADKNRMTTRQPPAAIDPIARRHTRIRQNGQAERTSDVAGSHRSAPVIRAWANLVDHVMRKMG